MIIQEKIDELINRNWIYLFLLVIIGLVSYVISIPKLGFYWDDWQAVFLYQNYDIGILREFFFYDRPFSAWTYELFFTFLPMNPFAWQLLTMLLRVMAIWFLISTLEDIWEDKSLLFRWSGALLLVFPSFTMQSISVAFNQHFLTYLLFCSSIYFMVLGVIKNSKWRWLFFFLANVLTIFHIFTMEYFVGLEIIRPIILFFAIKKRNPGLKISQLLLICARYYTMFLIIIFGFIYWRIQIYPNQIIGDPNNPIFFDLLIENPAKNLIKFANLIVQDVIYLLTRAWFRSIEPNSIRLDAAFYIFSIFLGMLISFVFAIFNTHQKNEHTYDGEKTSNKVLILIGFCAVFFGGFTIWITDRQLLQGKWSDRFSLAPIVGVVILIIIFLDWLIQNQKRKKIILIFVLGLAIAFQMRTTHSYGLDWVKQQDYYWQLYWRVPAVKPGTAFFSSKLPSNTSSRFSIGFFVNTLYSQDASNSDLSHWYFSNGDEGKYFTKLQPGNEIKYDFRNLTFEGSTSNAIAFMHKPEMGCLLLLDDAYEGYIGIDQFHLDLISINNPDQIDISVNPVTPQKNIFGNEPERNWCYYFAKADLARQFEDWNEVLLIMDKAYSLGLEPISGVEIMPEMEAYFYLENWPSFIEVSKSIYSMNNNLDEFLCMQWTRLEDDMKKSYPSDVIIELRTIVSCPIFD